MFEDIEPTDEAEQTEQVEEIKEDVKPEYNFKAGNKFGEKNKGKITLQKAMKGNAKTHIFKALFNLPMNEFIKYINNDKRNEIVEIFGGQSNINKLNVEQAISTRLLTETILNPIDMHKFFSAAIEQVYGKAKEQAPDETQIIEIPQAIDPIDQLELMDINTLEMFLQRKKDAEMKLLEAKPESVIQDDFLVDA